MIIAILNVCVFALLCVLVVFIIEWIAGMFGVPANILMIIRAIFGLMVLVYLINILLGELMLDAGSSFPCALLREGAR